MFVKRIFDLIVVLVALPIWFPVLLVLAMAVRWRIGRPIFFRQTRPGRDEVIFEMLKFRTMTDARDSAGQLLSDSERLTSFGKWLR